MRLQLSIPASVLICAAALAAPRPQPTAALPQDPGVYAETDAGTVPLRKTFSGIEIAASMPTGARTRALVFPIGTLDGVPTTPNLASFIVNLATVQDTVAASAQMRFAVGEHQREPDFQTMAVTVGKFRTGTYRIGSPQLTHDWLATAYVKLTSTRKWRDKHPPAIVGLVVNSEMYPVRIDEASLAVK